MVAAVIAGRGDRLGARLRNLLCAWRWARHAGAPLILAWPDWDLIERKRYPFHDLFDRAGIRAIADLVVVETGPRAKGDFPDQFTADRPGWTEARAARAHWRAAQTIAPDELRHLPDDLYVWFQTTEFRALPGDGPRAEAIEQPRLFAELPINAQIAAAVDAALPDGAHPPVALHIRRGDTVAHLFGRSGLEPDQLQSDIESFVARYAHLDAYARAVEQLYPGTPISVFSDDVEARAATAARFDGRVVDVHAALDRFDLTYAQRAFAEFLVISRSRAVIGARSQFSILPAKLGGISIHDIRKFAEADEVIAEVQAWLDASGRCTAAEKPGLMARIMEALARCYGVRLPRQRDDFLAAAGKWAEVASRPHREPPRVAGVIAGRGDRLGSRLRNLLAAWRWARVLHAPLLVNWPDWEPVAETPFPFFDLFDRAGVQAIEELVVVETEPLRRAGGAYTANRPGWAEAQAVRRTWLDAGRIGADGIAAVPRDAYIRYRSLRLLPLSGEGSQAGPELPELFAALPIHPAVRQAVDAAAPDPANPPVALHVRRGDIVRALFAPDAPDDAIERGIEAFAPLYAHIGAYVRAVAADYPDAPVSIFSDDPAVRDELAHHFASDRLIDPHVALDRFSQLMPAQRAFAEMLLIARSRAVVAAHSQFAILPALIGGVRHVDVRTHAEVEETLAELHAWAAASARDDRPLYLARILDGLARTYRRLRLPPQAEGFQAEAARLRLSASGS